MRLSMSTEKNINNISSLLQSYKIQQPFHYFSKILETAKILNRFGSNVNIVSDSITRLNDSLEESSGSYEAMSLLTIEVQRIRKIILCPSVNENLKKEIEMQFFMMAA